MSTIAIAADTVSQPSPAPADDKEPTRPEEERPDPEDDPGVGDIDDLPRPDWNDALRRAGN